MEQETRVGALVIARQERRAFFHDTELNLTSREFEVLAALAAHPGWVLSCDQIADSEDPCGLASSSAVNVHISHLRAKLDAVGGHDLVMTVRGIGWRLDPPGDDEGDQPARGSPVAVVQRRAAESATSEDSMRQEARSSLDTSDRLEALDRLADGAADAIRELRGLLGDEDPAIVQEAHRLLREMGVPTPVEGAERHP